MLTGVSLVAGAALAHSLLVRGPGDTLLLCVPAVTLAAAGEYVLINRLKLLHHHMSPQLARVPLSVAIGWYTILYGMVTMAEGLLLRLGLGAGALLWGLPLATSVIALSFDLLIDCFGLDLGWWEWQVNGSYAADILGPNGNRGIPLANFILWAMLCIGTALPYALLSACTAGAADGSGHPWAGRGAALLLLPHYLLGVGWSLYRRKLRYLLYSLPFAVVLILSLVGR